MKLTLQSDTLTWLDDRVGIETLKQLAQKKEVPLHRHTIWYYFGGMTLFLFAVQMITGVLLLFYYKPGAETAFESVQYIMADVRFGWLIRSIHSWSANLMIFTMFVHMFSVFLLKAYRAPRELTWVSGSLLFFIILGFGFSGYLLPWNKLAYFATKVGTEIAGVVPIIGQLVLRFLRGGDEVTGATLTRFYGLHVSVLPAITLLLLVAHILFVQRQGMSVPKKFESKKLPTMKFVPNFLLRDVLGWLLVFAALISLATIFPWELGEKADPFAPAPAGIKPEWFFLFMFQTLKLLPAKIGFMDGEVLGALAFGIGGMFWMLVPFLDRKAVNGKNHRLFTILGVIILLYIITMTVWGYLA
ncbi:MAG: cytochrome bc complex cytochrome b subunit [Acidobacteriota bacterium]